MRIISPEKAAATSAASPLRAFPKKLFRFREVAREKRDAFFLRLRSFRSAFLFTDYETFQALENFP